MPNIQQIRKREPRKWTLEAMAQALQEGKAGRLTLRQATQQFGVPKSSPKSSLTESVEGCPLTMSMVRGHSSPLKMRIPWWSTVCILPVTGFH
ncbi:hypothetical protein VZT92_004572 [Zoarces viviparus]|uniref:HTH psq-type domain-containing protein n=1 Tax=Zoarces viviparus TaxID=48416 RepID=A0AAW1FX44_ZOAVI